jgi:molybdopterin converting factor small subunit
VAYAIENALFQWEEGEARVRESAGGEASEAERATRLVVEELRRRLGGSFTLAELVDLYAEGTDWVGDEVQRRFSDLSTASAVNAGFWRYARSASDYAGGRRRVPDEEAG